MVIFHSYINVYQRVTWLNSTKTLEFHLQLSGIKGFIMGVKRMHSTSVPWYRSLRHCVPFSYSLESILFGRRNCMYCIDVTFRVSRSLWKASMLPLWSQIVTFLLFGAKPRKASKLQENSHWLKVYWHSRPLIYAFQDTLKWVISICEHFSRFEYGENNPVSLFLWTSKDQHEHGGWMASEKEHSEVGELGWLSCQLF